MLRWIVIFLSIYLVLPLLFSIFPGTQGVADTLLGYVISPVQKILLALWRYPAQPDYGGRHRDAVPLHSAGLCTF